MNGSAENTEDIWQLHDFLSEKRKELDDKYDYRYSVLILVFGRLLREGWLELNDIQELDEDKIEGIKNVAVSAF